MERPLPFRVLRLLDRCSIAAVPGNTTWTIYLPYGLDEGKHARQEAERVLEALGGAPLKQHYTFDFNPRDVLNKVLVSGCLQDEALHQFYSAPTSVAEAALELLDAGPEDSFLEPSAGLSGLACLLPTERTTCVEISGLRCEVLRALGYETHHADFIAWAAAQRTTSARWAKVLMNPPFFEHPSTRRAWPPRSV